MQTKRLTLVCAAALAAVTISFNSAFAAPGDLLATLNVPVPSSGGIGIGFAVTCDDPALMYYTNSHTPFLYMTDAAATDLGSVPLIDAATGASISFGAISWDDSRGMLWGGTDDYSDPPSVYLIDPATGLCTYVFTLMNSWIGFIDGIAVDRDETIWVTDDVSEIVEHWTTAGGYIGSITPTNAAGEVLGSLSGVAVGVGDLLYLGRNGHGEIVAVTKAGAYVGMFATASGRDEDLECDLVTFAPLEALWSKDAYGDYVEAFEVEPGTCECASGTRLVSVDFKPQSCPNPLNINRGGVAGWDTDVSAPDALGKKPGPYPEVSLNMKGVFPIAIVGTDELDVTMIDPATVMLEGVAPLRWNYEDVTTPVDPDPSSCECTTDGPDGYTDLTFKFAIGDIIAAVGAVADGDVLSMTVTGMLYDGTVFEGYDCVIIRDGGHEGGVTLEELELLNYPNPFNPGTKISFKLPYAGHVELTIYNVAGQRVTTLVDDELAAGEQSVNWEAADNYSSGIYFYRLSFADLVVTRKMTLLK